MDTPQTLAEWAQQMADLVEDRARAREQRHQAATLNRTRTENIWVKGIDEVVETLEVLVRVLKQTGHFPQLTLLPHARSPQGTSTYMRRGTLLSLKGLEPTSPMIDFEIDPTPPFQPDILSPIVRVVTKQRTTQVPGQRREHFCFGVTLHGAVVWQLLDPALQMPQAGSVEEMLKGFLVSLLLSDRLI